MLLQIGALVVSFVPSILFFLFLRNNHKEDPKYRKDCMWLLLMGFLICGAVLLLDFLTLIPWRLTGIGENYPIIGQLFKCFILNATVEELCKFLVARWFIRKNKATVSKLDILSYLIIAAISFGLVEDIVYALSTSPGQILVRGVLMGHVPYEMVMGLFYGEAIEENERSYMIPAFLLPILLHGTYNFCLTENPGNLAIAVVMTETAAEFIFMIIMIFFIRKRRKDPGFTCPVFPQEAIAEAEAGEAAEVAAETTAEAEAAAEVAAEVETAAEAAEAETEAQ